MQYFNFFTFSDAFKYAFDRDLCHETVVLLVRRDSIEFNTTTMRFTTSERYHGNSLEALRMMWRLLMLSRKEANSFIFATFIQLNFFSILT